MLYQTDEKHLYQVLCRKIALFLFISPFFSARANHHIVELIVREGITATACYSRGDKAKPDILSLPNILTTREHTSANNLKNTLKDNGNSILAAMRLNLSDMTKLYKQMPNSI